MGSSLLSAFLFSCILLLHPCSIVSVNHANTRAITGDVAVNFGSKWNSTALDGREWIGESASAAISGQSTSSMVVARSFLGVDHVPYMTSRISASPFHFTFQVNPGQKFVRFHFYPALYRGFEKSFDLFTVKVGPFTLLSHFSATLASSHLGVKYLVKEFCLNVEEHGKLRITFSPSKSREFKNHIVYAFVNGIEIVSMQVGLYYTPDGDSGAPVIGQKNRFYGIDNSTALEMVERLNIGGNFISSVEDFGMFRRWNADAGYFLESGESMMNYLAPKLTYTNVPLLIAPPKVYQTSWKTAKTLEGNQLYSFTWKLPINLGFGYLVRLHFCDLDAAMTNGEQKEFSILINYHIAEKHANVIRWSGGSGFPVHKDYVVMMKGDREGGESHLFVVIQSLNGLALELFKGLEIFKLSNPDNCLATPEPASLKKVTTTWKLNIRTSFSLFSQSNVIGTGLTIIVLIVNTTVYCLRIIWEENAYYENDAESTAVEPLGRHFSLADIRSVTQNFSDAFVIGRGGFGNVYKGLLSGFPEIVAIKRLSSFSRQGAREFWTEIEILSKLRHFNLVPLIGYCNEDEEMILVYEYIPGGTLADNLYKFARKGKDCALLSWEQRLRICIGSARGLEYLHTGSETGIIHRDVKDTNILLGENLVPKIADFGLSKLEDLTQSKSHISTHIKGTRGYLDPYYCATQNLTRKSDVYSFGIVMLVVLSGRPALDTKNLGDPESLLVCFQECAARDDFDKIVDPRICKSITPESLKEFVRSVGSCLEQGPKARPTMAQLVGSLELALQLQERPIVSVLDVVAVEVQPEQHFVLQSIQSGEMSQVLDATFEEGVVPSPVYEITNKISSSRGELTNHGRKPFRIWPWKIGQGRVTKPSKKKGPLKDEEEDVLILQRKLRDDRLLIFDGSILAFELEDMLSDYVEVLGKGSCGTTSKATLADGRIVAVKRWNDFTVEKEELYLHLKAVGSIRHENVVSLRVYSEVDNLIVYDYYNQGSVSALLHGNRGENRIPLDWESRARIAIGVARGIAHLHEKSTVHGNIKASNIFLNPQQYGCVSESGLLYMMSSRSTLSKQPPGYRAPEVMGTGRMSLASDVYSFGVLLLELLTGKSPVKSALGNEDIDLVRWVNSIVSEYGNRIRDAFDLDLLRDPKNEKGMVKMLQIGLKCVASWSWQRPKIMEVVEKLEDIETASSQNSHGDSREVYWGQGYNVPSAPQSVTTFSFGKESEMEEEKEPRYERRHSYDGAPAGSDSNIIESDVDDEIEIDRPPPPSNQELFPGFNPPPLDDDDLVARYKALKYYRSHSCNAAPARSDIKIDESNVDESEMERPPPPSNQETFSGFYPPPSDPNDLVARFEALKYYRSHSSNAAPAGSDSKFDESNVDDAIEMERPPPPTPSNQELFSGNYPQPPDPDDLVARFETLKYYRSDSYAVPQVTFDDTESDDETEMESLILPRRTPFSHSNYTAPQITFDDLDTDDELEMERPFCPEGAASRATLMQEKQESFSRVHPKLPDYDALVARLEAIRVRDTDRQ